jgi:acyl-CoA oxidase
MVLLARTISIIPCVFHSINIYEQKHKSPQLLQLSHSLSSILKVTATWHVLNLLSICRQACGGAGYRSANRIAGLIRDTHSFATFEGDNNVLTQQTAKYLLTLYAKGMSSGEYSGILSYANNRQALLEHIPEDDSKILSLKYQQYLFQEREFGILEELATKLQTRMMDGEAEWNAWTEELVTVKDLALAHSDRIVHELALESSQICSFENTGILSLTTKLNSLNQIQENLGWFVANEVLAPSLAKKVDGFVTVLSKQLVPHSLAIVDAFQIPDKLLPPRNLSDYTV